MSERVISISVYFGVLVILMALTLLTVGVSFVPLAGAWHITAGLTIGLMKASLVALVFMHVTSSPRLTWIVIVVAMFWLLLLFGLIFCDYVTRGIFPSMPGH
jgi:cytochrome c oxidase subunit IV